MSVNIFPQRTSDEWSLISSVTPTAGVSTLSFTGISGYSKLLLRIISPGQSVAADVRLTFNSDSTSSYSTTSGQGWSVTGGATFAPIINVEGTFASLISFPTSGDATSVRGAIIIKDTNTTGLKTYNGWMYKTVSGGAVAYPALEGAYFGSAAITTVTLTLSTGTFAATGTVALHGVKL